MNKRSKKLATKAKRSTRLSLAGILVVTVVLAVAGATVVSRNRTPINEINNGTDKKSPENFVTVKVAGQEVQVDSQTGQIRELSPDQARKLAEGLKRMINKSSEGLVETQHADGTVSVDLQGRFQNVTVARVNSDESVTQSCVDNPQAAGAFFRIDPKLIEQSDKNAASPTTPPVIAKRR